VVTTVNLKLTITAMLALAALVLAGCGYGETRPEGEIAQTAEDYLRALAAGDTSKACAQLAAAARTTLGRPCPETMRAIATRLGADTLTAAADRGLKIEVDGDRGSAEIRQLPGTRLALVRIGDRWKITSGHSLEP
jgi:hypothetical protein